MKYQSLVIVILVATLNFMSCSKSVSGTYVNQNNSSEYLELKSDGTFYFKGEKKGGILGKYEVEGDVITLKLEGGRANKVKIEGNKIVGEGGQTFVKQ